MMVSPFERLARSARSVVERVHGETIRLSFMSEGAIDPDRPQMVVCAILSTDDLDIARFRSSAKGDRSDFAACAAVLVLERVAYYGPLPVKGDRVRALDRPMQNVWEVSGAPARDGGLMRVPLVEVSG